MEKTQSVSLMKVGEVMAEEKAIEQENDVHIDVSLIPEWTQENLARATLEFMKRLLAQPGAREMLEKKKKELGLI